MNKTPNILIRTRFYPPKPNTKNTLHWAKKRAFYTCNTYYNVIDYLSRESATATNLSEDEKKIVQELQKEVINDKDILNYLGERNGSSGLFSKNGIISKNEINNIKEEMRKTNSIIWEGVISFETEYGKENCNTCEQAISLMQKAMPSFLKHSHLNYENIEWYGAFHTNTENYHIQFVMYEKTPQHLKKSGDLSFTNKGQIAKHNFDNAKLCIEKELLFEKDISFQKRNEIKSSFSKALWTQKREVLFLDDLQDLANQIPSTGRLGYDSENMKFLKPLIDRITTKLIQNSPELKKQYFDYKKYLSERKKKLENIYSNNNIKKSDKLDKYILDRIDDLRIKLGNITIRTAQSIKKFSEKVKISKTIDKNTRVYRKTKKDISLAKETSKFLAISNYYEESLKAVYELRNKLKESEELEIEQAKIEVVGVSNEK